MRKLLVLILVVSSSARAQTLDEARLAHNGTACDALGLATACTDAEASAAWSAANGATPRPIERQVFATPAAYRDNVLLPPLVKARVAQRRAEFANRVSNAIMSDSAKCIAIATSLSVDTAVCK